MRVMSCVHHAHICISDAALHTCTYTCLTHMHIHMPYTHAHIHTQLHTHTHAHNVHGSFYFSHGQFVRGLRARASNESHAEARTAFRNVQPSCVYVCIYVCMVSLYAVWGHAHRMKLVLHLGMCSQAVLHACIHV
jgi:hypothetical protein